MPRPLVLRDVHIPAAPSWWPPAPGWWLVLLAVLVLVAIAVIWSRMKRRRLRRWEALFDTQYAAAQTAQVAAASELLRRAARRVDVGADRLQGDAWLRFLDGKQGRAFSQGPGQLLADGGYRRHVDAGELELLRQIARARFVQLMEGRR